MPQHRLFDVSPEHIAALDDEGLRLLIARLCEADLRGRGLSTSAVLYGGNQIAADGGIDVRVELAADTDISGFIPRPVTGFQAKADDMPASEIEKEMRPKNKQADGTRARRLRPSIRTLAEAGGAYVIVSSKGSTTDSRLTERRDAIRAAVADLDCGGDLHVDFYDRTRMATWVSEYPGEILWLRNKIGQPLAGWRPFGNWSHAPEGADGEYFSDEKSRLRDLTKPQDDPLGVGDGIARLRSLLSAPGGIVRLTGLSGTGKTRLLEALFDPRVGDQPLDPAHAIYVDIGHDAPEPSAGQLADQLIAEGKRAILLLDNCPRETHDTIAPVCKPEGSPLSLITVDLDIRDEQPEHTDVFRLQNASEAVIESLLERRYPALSQAVRLAPVVPSAVLDVIERFAASSTLDELKTRECSNRQSIMSLLRKLAWFPEHFRRAVLLLSRFVQAGLSQDERNQDTRYLEELFWPVLSGTKTGPRERLEVVDELLSAPDRTCQETGMIVLSGMLHAGQFTSSHDFSFGARAVDYGYRLKTAADYQDWYDGALKIATQLALSDSFLRKAARHAMAEQFRSLWCFGYVFDRLEEAAVATGTQEHWPEGWLAVRTTLGLDSKRMEPGLVARLQALKERLAPARFSERVQSYVLTPAYKIARLAHWEAAEEYETASAAVFDEARQLGTEAGSDLGLLEGLWHELLGPNAHQAIWVGEGLAETVLDLSEAWAYLLERYGAIDHEQRNAALLGGFLRGAAPRYRAKVEGFLDDAVCDQLLGPVFPFLQVSVEVDEAGVRRLIASIEAGLAPSRIYWNLVLGKTTERIPQTALSHIVLGIAGLPNGHGVALEILSMHFYGQRNHQAQMDASMLECGRQLLRSYPLDQFQQTTDYELATIAKVCLRGSEAAEEAEIICRRIVDASSEPRFPGLQLDELVKAILTLHPLIALDCLLGGSPADRSLQDMRFFDIEDRNALSKVPTPILLEWAQRDPDTRLSTLAGAIPALVNEDKATAWSETALALLSAAPDRAAVLRGLAAQLHPSGWSGSLADILEQRRPLIQHFLDDEDSAVRQVAREVDGALLEDIAAERSREVDRDERFE